MRSRAVAAFVVVVAACNTSAAEPTATTPSSTTTTTIENDTCERVAADTVRFLDDLISELDETRLREFADRDAWPQELLDLERAGRDLDIRVRALRCDPGAIQQRAFSEADLDPEGPLSERLLELLLTPEEPATTTTSSTTTTSTTVPETTTSTAAGGAEDSVPTTGPDTTTTSAP